MGKHVATVRVTWQLVCIDSVVELSVCHVEDGAVLTKTLLKRNVTVYMGLFLEHPSCHVIVITVYTFLSLY